MILRVERALLLASTFSFACGPTSSSGDAEGTGDESTTTTTATASTTSTATTSVDTSSETTVDPSTTSTTNPSTTESSESSETTETLCEEHCCPLETPDTGTVTGTTPLGPIMGTYALYGWTGGECPGGYRVFVAESVTQFEDSLCMGEACCDVPEPGLKIYLDYGDWDALNWQGTGPASFYVGNDPNDEMVAADVTLTSVDQPFDLECADMDPWPTLVMSFDVDAPGWQISGQIAAPFCNELVILCP